jgi:thiol-disulfide isomerase/thioredoxin
MCSKKIFFKSGTTLVVSFLFFVTVSFSQKSNLQTGIWRGTLQLNDSTELPFNFDVKYDLGFYSVVFHNAEERIEANEINLKSDSVLIKMPFFDSEFRCKNMGDSLKGIWINHAKKTKNIISFSAKNNKSNRFAFQPTPPILSTERYKVIFEPGTKDEYFSVGSFASENGRTKGTFTTETGDYRYLEGYSTNGKFVVSCFDGSHAFLFSAIKKNDSLIKGVFYSGISGHENWVAIKDDTFELRNPDSLTFLKPGYTKFDFNFKNLEGKNVSIQDDKFKNKVVIIQIMGSWCPNCMDETKFLASFYDAYKPKGLEVVGLAFERTDDFAKAVNNINRMKNRFHANYEFLITMKTGADQASEALPMLNKVMAFPTSIYIDKKGVVRKIYTGFYGPATGEKYTQYIEDTKMFVEKLIAE